MNIRKAQIKAKYPGYHTINSFFNRDKFKQLTISKFLCYNGGFGIVFDLRQLSFQKSS